MCIRDRCGLMGGFAYVILARYGHDMIPEALLLGTWVGIMARVVSFNHFVVLPIFRSEGSAHSFPLHNQQFDAPYLGTRGNRKIVVNGQLKNPPRTPWSARSFA
eukprot:TRINITY_DN3220_c0_g1_i9.p1 TRINITY_DN3220_c0_g1~~TRINITY_DN3220_c0_g1_i9.p1  ORF type:complete len:104 (+),score=25.70 TRINITY_DN3220_c0_g1_i9:124-435(+)